MELDRELTLNEVRSQCLNEGYQGCRHCQFSIKVDDYNYTCPFYHAIPSEWQFKKTKTEPAQEDNSLRDYFRLTDNPVSPAHYQQGKRQTLDEMLIIFGLEAVKSFCLCNVYKYKTRAGLKNGAEDLAKADRYLTFYEHLCEYGRIKWDELEE